MIYTPVEDGVYPENLDCVWTVQAPPESVVQLTFLAFDVEQNSRCRHDYVTVYENTTSDSADLLGT